jgi:hypothetical protein
MFRRRRIDAHAADRINRLDGRGLIPVNTPAPTGMRMIERPVMRMGVIVSVIIVAVTARAAATTAALAFVLLSG